ncbi:MAG: dihydrofolate reductase [Candidatus Thermoplasmatota archaeon]|nr:dihydrofolate reductase [Candidatus Thermoplasmatota archaeon]
MPLHLIWAEDEAGGIGQDGDLPWRQRTDLQRFKALTLGHAVVMGRRTWESLPFPLPGRENLVLTRDPSWRDEGAERTTVEEVEIRSEAGETMFVIGGGEIYALMLPDASMVHRTVVHTTVVDADTHAPHLSTADWSLESSEWVGAQEGDQHDQTFERWARR